MPKDLFYPSLSDEKSKNKLKRLIQSPNSFFMDVKCPGCFHITTIFSHAQVSQFTAFHKALQLQLTVFTLPFVFFVIYATTKSSVSKLTKIFSLLLTNLQTVVVCAGCATVLSQPTGGKCRLTEGCSFRKKVD